MAKQEQQEQQEDDLICVDQDYNEVNCDDEQAAFRVTPEDAKERNAAVKKAAEVPAPEPAPEAEVGAEDATEPVEEKAVPSAPTNKAVSAKQTK